MRFTSFYPRSYRLFQGASFVVLSAALAGCSGNVTRFTDSLFTGSTTPQQASINKPIMADQQMPPVVSSSVESAELPPPSQPDYPDTASYDVAQSAAQHATATPTTTLGAPPRNLGTLPANETWDESQSVTPAATSDETGSSNNLPKTYVVQSGDTLSGIAARTGTRVALLKQANNLDGDMIRIGQKLNVPQDTSNNVQMVAVRKEQINPASVSTQKASSQQMREPQAQVSQTTQDTASTKAPLNAQKQVADAANVAASSQSSPPSSPQEDITPNEQKIAKSVNPTSDKNQATNIEETQQVAAIAPQATGIAQLRWPARGRILSSFGDREGTFTNDGLDIMVPEGTSIKAAENGVVIYAGDGLKEFGKTILIRHEDNLVTVYGHNSNLLVQRGQQVRRGDEIAKSGMSGNATSPKLHFEVRKNSSPVNPVKYLEK